MKMGLDQMCERKVKVSTRKVLTVKTFAEKVYKMNECRGKVSTTVQKCCTRSYHNEGMLQDKCP